MKKKIIKLINNEKTKTNLNSAKACDLMSSDECSEKDNAECTLHATDTCTKDHAACSFEATDICTYDFDSCSGVNEYDTCGTDYSDGH